LLLRCGSRQEILEAQHAKRPAGLAPENAWAAGLRQGAGPELDLLSCLIPEQVVTMHRDFSTRFVAWSFIAAAIMLWGGWMLMPAHIGTFFDPDDFARIHARFHFWIWTFRVHLFGMVITVIALVALASLLTNSQARVMVWPGTAVATAGFIVGALGAAFYYHHGAWGAVDMNGKSTAEIQAFVDALRVDTEYVTCLVRFGRVFSGLGLVVLGFGLMKWRIVPAWTSGSAVAIGLAAMALTMLLPDRLSLYMPVFHILSLWLLVMGVVILQSGVNVKEASSPGGW
jgi:hypothetical protein